MSISRAPCNHVQQVNKEHKEAKVKLVARRGVEGVCPEGHTVQKRSCTPYVNTKRRWESPVHCDVCVCVAKTVLTLAHSITAKNVSGMPANVAQSLRFDVTRFLYWQRCGCGLTKKHSNGIAWTVHCATTCSGNRVATTCIRRPLAI